MQKFLSAYQILDKIYNQKTYVNIALKNLPKQNSAIVTNMVYGCIENDIELEYIINTLVKKIKDKEVFLLLKLGTYCVLHLNNLPDFYIVNTMVDLTKKLGFSSAAGLVNAVLKKVIKKEYKLPKTNATNYLSVTYSKPQWFIDELIKDYGKDFTTALLQFKPQRKTSIRVNKNLISVEKFKELLLEKNISFEQTKLSNCLYVSYPELLKNQDLNLYYTAQGLSSVFAVDMFDFSGVKTALDACAAPGGKSAYIAEKLGVNGKVESWDIHPHRIELIDKYMLNLQLKNYVAKVKDATVFNKEYFEKFDIVLCDVLCSGSGTFLDKPDVLLNKKPEDIKALNIQQKLILNNCSKYVKKGGQLIYSTCSILKSENEQIIDNFLKENKNFKLDLPEAKNIVFSHIKTNGICLFPHISETEGFFVSKMRKI